MHGVKKYFMIDSGNSKLFGIVWGWGAFEGVVGNILGEVTGVR